MVEDEKVEVEGEEEDTPAPPFCGERIPVANKASATPAASCLSVQHPDVNNHSRTCRGEQRKARGRVRTDERNAKPTLLVTCV